MLDNSLGVSQSALRNRNSNSFRRPSNRQSQGSAKKAKYRQTTKINEANFLQVALEGKKEEAKGQGHIKKQFEHNRKSLFSPKRLSLNFNARNRTSTVVQ